MALNASASMTYENGTTVYYNSTAVGTPAPTPSPGLLPNKSTATSIDTCGCTDLRQTPRTCHDCLNVLLPGGERCVVTPLGGCMSESTAAVFKRSLNSSSMGDPKSNYSVIPQSDEYFSSSNATYCESNDTMCASCRTQWLEEFRYDSLRSTKKFSCLGDGGCICTAYCELRAEAVSLPSSNNFGQETCAPFSIGNDFMDASIKQILTICGMLLASIVFVLSVRWWIKAILKVRYERRMRATRLAQRQRNQTGRFGVALSLEGWTSYREQLIKREQESFGCKSKPLIAEAPTQVIIQEGEGFRPESPSQLARERIARLT